MSNAISRRLDEIERRTKPAPVADVTRTWRQVLRQDPEGWRRVMHATLTQFGMFGSDNDNGANGGAAV